LSSLSPFTNFEILDVSGTLSPGGAAMTFDAGGSGNLHLQNGSTLLVDWNGAGSYGFADAVGGSAQIDDITVTFDILGEIVNNDEADIVRADSIVGGVVGDIAFDGLPDEVTAAATVEDVDERQVLRITFTGDFSPLGPAAIGT